jgi:aerobic carbon-monoxide dehydrogenase medium subunit
MKPPRFLYCDPETIEDAVALKAEYGDDSLVLAGGQSLMPILNMRLASPSALIDINGITDLQQVRLTADETGADVLEIGAGVRQAALERDERVRASVPLLARAIPYIGHVENRHRGTVGGSIAHADSAAELPCVAVALDAVIVVRGPAGERRIPAADFFEGFLTNALAPDELVVAVRFPVTPPAAGTAFVEVARREGDFALAAAGAVVELGADGRFGRVGIGVAGIASTPVRATAVEEALTGAAVAADAVAEAAALIAGTVTTGDDLHASSAYRRHLAVTVVQRAVLAAAADAHNRSSS